MPRTRTRARSSSSRRIGRPASSPASARAKTSAAAQSSRSRAATPRSASRSGMTGRLPEREASSTARANSASARSASPSSRYDKPLTWSMVARYGLAALRPVSASSASRRISSMPSRHSRARRYASVASVVFPSASVPVGSARSAAAAHRSVACGSAGQREHEGPVHGDRRMTLEQVVRLEPLHPAHHGVATPARPDRIGYL